MEMEIGVEHCRLGQEGQEQEALLTALHLSVHQCCLGNYYFLIEEVFY